MLDGLAVGMVMVFGLLGYTRGILRQGLTVAALVASYFASALLAAPLAGWVPEDWQVTDAMAHVIGRALGGAMVFVSLSLASHLIDKRIGRTQSGVPVPWNRNLGGLAGVAFGLLLAFCGLCLADAYRKAYPASDGWWARAIDASYFRRQVQLMNPADRFLITDSLKLIRRARNNPEALKKLAEKEELKALLDDPLIQEILQDEELMSAIQNRDLKRVAGDEKITRLLTNAELRKKVFSPQVRAAFSEAVEEMAHEDDDAQPAEEPAGPQDTTDMPGSPPLESP